MNNRIKTLAYSYMPMKGYEGKSQVDAYCNRPDQYAIDSDERVLAFRNQYGEKFAFVPYATLKIMCISSFVAGFLAALILRLL